MLTARELLRSQAPLVTPGDEFVVKSLKANAECFYHNFLVGITGGQKTPLRLGAKRKFTVTAEGIFKRRLQGDETESSIVPLKTPQYTAEEKQGFSKAQAASFCTKDHHSRVFMDPLSNVVVGFYFDKQDILFTNRNYIEDALTVVRSYDFDDIAEAEKYYQQQRDDKRLFTMHEMPQFVAELKRQQNPFSENTYNEVLVRLRWSSRCKIFVAKDTLESRLQAQEFARLLRQRLQKMQHPDADKAVDIVYYMPQSPLHFKLYTQEEQVLDRDESLSFYNDINLRHKCYDDKKYQLLLALPTDEIMIALSEVHNGKLLLWHLIEDGLIHIVDSLTDKLGCSLDKLVLDTNFLPDSLNQKAIMHLLRTGHESLASALIEKRPIDLFDCFNEIESLDDTRTSLIHYAILHNHLTFMRTLLDCGMRIHANEQVLGEIKSKLHVLILYYKQRNITTNFSDLMILLDHTKRHDTQSVQTLERQFYPVYAKFIYEQLQPSLVQLIRFDPACSVLDVDCQQQMEKIKAHPEEAKVCVDVLVKLAVQCNSKMKELLKAQGVPCYKEKQETFWFQCGKAKNTNAEHSLWNELQYHCDLVKTLDVDVERITRRSF